MNPEQLDPLRRDPAGTCVVTDFDGTLAAIVRDPSAARPLAGVPAVLRRLAGKYGRVAVVSGRPVSFLAEHLGLRGDLPPGLAVAGLYGLETLGPAGEVVVGHEAERWRPVVARAAERLEAEAPPGLLVERKGLSVTLHWRSHPDLQPWVEEAVTSLAAETGLVAHPARRSAELRPPLEVDKGTVVHDMADGFHAVCYLGDDVGDLPAFAALDRLGRRGRKTLKVAVGSSEAPPELIGAADLVLDGPEAALAFLEALADH